MEQPKYTFLKFISIIHRNTLRYYDSILEEYHIGGGQQFFLIHISENEGITMYDLAKMGNFDKGTVTKAVRKLEEQEYVRVQTDEADRRIRHLFTTEKAGPIIQKIYQVRRIWKDALIEDIPVTEEVLYDILQNMAKRSCEARDQIIKEKKGE